MEIIIVKKSWVSKHIISKHSMVSTQSRHRGLALTAHSSKCFARRLDKVLKPLSNILDPDTIVNIVIYRTGPFSPHLLDEGMHSFGKLLFSSSFYLFSTGNTRADSVNTFYAAHYYSPKRTYFSETEKTGKFRRYCTLHGKPQIRTGDWSRNIYCRQNTSIINES